MEEFVRKIREEVKYTKNYDDQLAEFDAKLKSDNLLKVPLSELRENLFDLLLKVLNDKQFKQKTLLLTSCVTHVLRDCQHWRQESVKTKDQLVDQLLGLIEESIFSQNEDAIKIDLVKIMLEASCINANAIAFDNLVRIINLSCKLITETHGRSFNKNQLNQSSESSLVLATYTSSAQIIENFILYYDDEATKLQNVSIQNGYLCADTNCDSLDDLRTTKFKSVKTEKLGNKLLSLLSFLIDRYDQAEEDGKIELKHFYLSSILVCLKCCTDQEKVLLKLDMKLKEFLANKFANFISRLLDCKVQKPVQIYFKLELKKSDTDKSDGGSKNGAKTESKTDRKFFLDEKLIKLIYLICEELFKVFSEFRCLRPTLVSITFKMCSSDDNQFYILKCINRIFKNHLLLFKLFYLTCRNEILIDTSVVRLLLDSNKKTYQLISSANSTGLSTISALASQSIANINTLTESCNKIIQEFTCPGNIVNYRKLETNEFEKTNSYDDLNLNFENYKNKLDDLLTSDEESLNGDSDRLSASNRNNDQITDTQNERNQRSESFDESSSHSDEHSSSDLDQKEIQSRSVLKFVQFLRHNLPSLMRCKSILKIDDLIQRLSSEFCDQIKCENSLIINADGIYAAIFCSLSLNYQLFYQQTPCDKSDKCDTLCDRKRCDRKTNRNNFKSEEQFVEEIHKSGLIVFLSASWIKEVYQQLMETNLFDELLSDSMDRRDLINQPLIKLILDLDNKSFCELIDYHKLSLNSLDQLNKLDACPGHLSKSLAHKVNLMSELLDCVWPYMLNNLSYALRKDLKSFEKPASGDQDVKQSSLELIRETLKSTEQLIRVLYQLSKTEKCVEIFDLFLSTILTDLDENGPEKQASLNVFQVIAMRIILKYSMQLACDCPSLWGYFFSCSNYISNMEHKFFTEKLNRGQNHNLQKYRKMLKNLPKKLSKKLNRSPKKDDRNSLNLGDLLHNMNNLNDNLNDFDELNESVDSPAKFDALNSSNTSINLIDDCDSLNEFSFGYTDFGIDKLDEFYENLNGNIQNSSRKSDKKNSISEDNHQIEAIIEKALEDSKLTVGPDDVEAFINHLCRQSTRVFEDSALKLNLRYLVQFLEQLISNSNRQLYSIANQDKSRTNSNPKSSIKTVKIFDYNCLLFDRFCDVIIKIFKSSRPIFHLMKSLQLASEHLIEAASFDYSEKVRKTSISTLNDLISNFLLNHLELNHFHFNETLFKPYETLLLLELCEMGIQEMVISSINGFVEGFENEIGSAWKSVFRAFCGVRLFTESLSSLETSKIDQQTLSNSLSWTEQIECVRQLRVIVDIFDSFLKIRNFEVFNQGAIDCLNCLFKMLKKSACDSENGLDLDELKSKNSFISLSLISLKCLHQFETTLQEFHSNEDLLFNHKPSFYLITFKTKLIDVNHCDLDFVRLLSEDSEEKNEKEREKKEVTPMNSLKEDLAEDQQRLNKILEDWYYYLHGLATSIELCSIDHQSKMIEILLSSLSFLIKNGDREFGIYSINHIAFDAIQSWSNSLNRKLTAQSHESDLVLNKIEFSSYKHFCIMITNLIVEFLGQDQPCRGTNLLIFQFYVLFCQLLVGDYNFMISTLSVSCLKHVFKESTRFLNDQQFELVLYVLHVIGETSLRPFRKMLDFFETKKENVEGCKKSENANDKQTNESQTNEIADLNLVGKLISEQDNQLALEAELALQLLLQSYLNNQMELTDTGYLTKLYSFDIENENFTINKIVRKLLFIDFILKEAGGLVLSSLKQNYDIKRFSSFDFDNLERTSFGMRINLIRLIEDVHHVFECLDKSTKIKFLIQKISMFKPLVNFYQINSVCVLLKFLFYFDQLCNRLSERNESAKEPCGAEGARLRKEELVERLAEMLGKLAKDYTTFKIERKLNKAEEPRYSEFVRKIGSKEETQKSDLREKLDRFDRLVKDRFSNDPIGADKEQANLRKACVDSCIYDQSRNLDFDTESYLIIYNKLIAELLCLQVDLNTAYFSYSLPCFLSFDYYLLAYKNDDFTQKLHELLIKLDQSRQTTSI